MRRIDDLGRVVIQKEIRRTMRIREGDPSLTTLSQWEKFCLAMMQIDQRAAFISVWDYEAIYVHRTYFLYLSAYTALLFHKFEYNK